MGRNKIKTYTVYCKPTAPTLLSEQIVFASLKYLSLRSKLTTMKINNNTVFFNSNGGFYLFYINCAVDVSQLLFELGKRVMARVSFFSEMPPNGLASSPCDEKTFSEE